jgi:hypothetical protein
MSDDDFDELAFWKAEAEFYRNKWSECLRSSASANDRIFALEKELAATRADLLETMRKLEREQREHNMLWKAFNKRADVASSQKKEKRA